MNAEKKKTILHMHQEGKSPAAIARATKESWGNVANFLKENFGEIKNHSTAIHTIQEEKEIIKLYESGLTLREIGSKIGTDKNVPRRVLMKNGIRIKQTHEFKYEKKKMRITSDGYRIIRVGKRSWEKDHRVIAERILGRKIRRNEVVHHVDGDRTNNTNTNLLICSRGYHSWLHARMNGHNKAKHK